jgi:hypothetical protein
MMEFGYVSSNSETHSSRSGHDEGDKEELVVTIDDRNSSRKANVKVKWRESSIFELLPFYGELHLWYALLLRLEKSTNKIANKWSDMIWTKVISRRKMLKDEILEEQMNVWGDKRKRMRFRTAMIAKLFTFQIPWIINPNQFEETATMITELQSITNWLKIKIQWCRSYSQLFLDLYEGKVPEYDKVFTSLTDRSKFIFLQNYLNEVRWIVDETELFHLSEDAHPKIKSAGHLVVKVGSQKHNETLKKFYKEYIIRDKFRYSYVLFKICYSWKYSSEDIGLLKKVAEKVPLKMISDPSVPKHISIQKNTRTVYLSCLSARVISELPKKEITLYTLNYPWYPIDSAEEPPEWCEDLGEWDVFYSMRVKKS